MTYHLSHFAAGIQAKTCVPITNEELAQAGLKQSDFQDPDRPAVVRAQKEYGQNDQTFWCSPRYPYVSASTTTRRLSRKQVYRTGWQANRNGQHRRI